MTASILAQGRRTGGLKQRYRHYQHHQPLQDRSSHRIRLLMSRDTQPLSLKLPRS